MLGGTGQGGPREDQDDLHGEITSFTDGDGTCMTYMISNGVLTCTYRVLYLYKIV